MASNNKTQIKDFTKCQKQSTLHVMPCSINHDGPANVSAFFPVDTSEMEGSKRLRAHYRGRALDGSVVHHPFVSTVIKLPDDCEGVCLSAGEGFHETEGLFYEVKGKFNEAVVWQHDRIEGVDDTVNRALSWIDLAAAIHDE